MWVVVLVVGEWRKWGNFAEKWEFLGCGRSLKDMGQPWVRFGQWVGQYFKVILYLRLQQNCSHKSALMCHKFM
ncbi:hypothetical protein HAX54_041718, partial [Datura stramonium]|nr:hypothetical protein [Datura stramonium]